ncbi:MAG TPA: polysaccharide biosynthesis protein [Streptosporangiaceae bacterium]
MRQAVPPGRETLDDASLTQLRDLTRALLEAKPDAQQEYARFLAISERALPLPDDELDAWLRGKTVVVVGGTGCIGSKLMQQVEIRCPKRLVSVGRGITDRYPRLPGAEYVQADIRDRQRLTIVLGELRPDVVFHVAAQRDPGLAEQEVHRTLSTNVLGTENVIKVAAELGVPQVVCASTGKALRPYSPDVYTASKRVAEWLVAAAAGSSTTTTYSTARFTHVVDNSIIHGRLLDWCRGGVIRLHSADIGFYGESALESAQLLLAAGLGGRPGELRVHAITDLGWPVTLLDVTLGVLARTGSATPIYVSGYDRGYEPIPFPGLYDPLTAGEVSPLLSAFEAASAEPMPGEMVDAFPLAVTPGPELDRRLQELDEACRGTEDPAVLRPALDQLSWALLDATLSAVDQPVLARAAQLTVKHQGTLIPEHRRMLAAIMREAGISESALV